MIGHDAALEVLSLGGLGLDLALQRSATPAMRASPTLYWAIRSRNSCVPLPSALRGSRLDAGDEQPEKSFKSLPMRAKTAMCIFLYYCVQSHYPT